MTEYHVYGGPGTGKTTYLSRKVSQLLDEGISAGGIYITSFSRTGAATIAERVAGLIPEDNIGTLQSFGFQSLGARKEQVIDAFTANGRRPPDSHPIHEWNREHPAFAFHFAAQGGTHDDVIADDISEMYDRYSSAEISATGRNALNRANINRHRLLDIDQWNLRHETFGDADANGAAIVQFYRHWKLFKEMRNLIDFTDMVELPYKGVLPFSGRNPVQVLVVDEAQDLTPLMIARVVQVYEEYIESAGGDMYVSMDDDQTLYSHTGCTPEPWFERERTGQAKSAVLPRSYRMSRRVQEYGFKIAHLIPNRREKKFASRDEVGDVDQLDCDVGSVDAPLSEMLGEHRDETFMVLATTNFYANMCAASMRRRAIPFWNPYRKENPFWNPLHGTRGVRTADRLSALLKPSTNDQPWTLHDIMLWKELINKTKSAGTLNNARIEAYAQDYPDALHEPVSDDVLPTFFRTQESKLLALAGDIDWIGTHWRTGVPDYPLTIMTYYGVDALRNDPRCIVGTIHSVKGGEADNVIVLPDISRAAQVEYERDPTAMLRTMYVAVTRARKRVYLGWPKDARQPHFEWPDWRRSKLGAYAEKLIGGGAP